MGGVFVAERVWFVRFAAVAAVNTAIHHDQTANVVEFCRSGEGDYPHVSSDIMHCAATASCYASVTTVLVGRPCTGSSLRAHLCQLRT